MIAEKNRERRAHRRSVPYELHYRQDALIASAGGNRATPHRSDTTKL